LPPPEGEETLDTEWSSSMAPGAKVRVYATQSLSFTGIDQAYQQVYSDVVNHPELGIHQMSMSFGIGELYESPSQIAADDQFFAELASAGVTVFASSGDAGSTPDEFGEEYGVLQVDSPACDPYVTGVGGTALTLDANGNASSETVWNTYGLYATGGGISQVFTRPAWQTGAGVPAGGMRAVPDVASVGDPDTGAVLFLDGSPTIVGGTSWSSPVWAGYCALFNQMRAQASAAPIGLLGPNIYPLLSSSSFRDITSGSNATPVSHGNYSATTGYDPVTGIGVPNVYNLAQALACKIILAFYRLTHERILGYERDKKMFIPTLQ